MGDGRDRDGNGGGGDREKPSWREIDKGRDKSKHSSGGSAGGAPAERSRDGASRAYRQKLDRLFKEGGIGKAVAKLDGAHATDEQTVPSAASASATTCFELMKIARRGDDQIARMNALRRLATEFELPDDFDLLALALEHAESRVVGKALTQLDRLLATDRPARKASLIQRLRLVESASDDTDQIALAAKLRAMLE